MIPVTEAAVTRKQIALGGGTSLRPFALEGTMQNSKDVVCGMTVDIKADTPRATHKGQELYFCSEQCKKKFEATPDQYFDLERHEPPYTVSGGVAAPKFGSAGSGGLENEPGPEQHDRK